ncbi:hypothetical protein P171DRAFT_247432 [Karstenula rhodostoma CBS 690.94]|uniref:Uncharacterized protein n=1 Tax=Karstenula rhodostoma CBS 690.94 TaxID=1392251 RepID=A0A9P4PNG5_9PLEO|nr:hypothetical protein P171DRAFT_247432 [Karstenula rhodostoma CBS 690.94]
MLTDARRRSISHARRTCRPSLPDSPTALAGRQAHAALIADLITHCLLLGCCSKKPTRNHFPARRVFTRSAVDRPVALAAERHLLLRRRRRRRGRPAPSRRDPQPVSCVRRSFSGKSICGASRPVLDRQQGPWPRLHRRNTATGSIAGAV